MLIKGLKAGEEYIFTVYIHPTLQSHETMVTMEVPLRSHHVSCWPLESTNIIRRPGEEVFPCSLHPQSPIIDTWCIRFPSFPVRLRTTDNPSYRSWWAQSVDKQDRMELWRWHDWGLNIRLFLICDLSIVEMVHWVQWLPRKHEVLSLILKVALTTTHIRHDTVYLQYQCWGGRNTRIPWGSLTSHTNQITEFQISEKPFLTRKVDGAWRVTVKVALQLPHAWAHTWTCTNGHTQWSMQMWVWLNSLNPASFYSNKWDHTFLPFMERESLHENTHRCLVKPDTGQLCTWWYFYNLGTCAVQIHGSPRWTRLHQNSVATLSYSQ